MIDFHNHILPNVDDGSKSIEMTLDMLRNAESQGITDVVNTVHFQHPKMDNKNVDYDFIQNKIKMVQSALDKNNIKIKIHCASEVFYLPNLIDILNNPITTFGNGKYMLIEFQTLLLPNNYKDELFKLQLQNITPVIAHPERYRKIQDDIQILEEWIELGYIIQVDCGSIIGTFGKKAKRTSEYIIKNNLCHLIGSDAHNNTKRNFCLLEAYEILSKLVNSQFVKHLKANSNKIIIGDKVYLYEYGIEQNRLKKNKISIIKKYIYKMLNFKDEIL